MSAAVSDFEHLCRAPASLLRYVEGSNAAIIEQLGGGASNALINGLRTCTMERTIIAVGTIGVFEAMIQRKLGGRQAFDVLDQTLRDKERGDLADRFQDFRTAINVLKHGEGASYERLLARKDELPFSIMERGAAFLDEGDVSEVSRLIAVDARFIDQSVAIIEEIKEALGFG